MYVVVAFATVVPQPEWACSPMTNLPSCCITNHTKVGGRSGFLGDLGGFARDALAFEATAAPIQEGSDSRQRTSCRSHVKTVE